MIARAVMLLMAGITLGTPGPAAPPLRDGERLSYRVSWAVVPGAGEIKIGARQESTADGPRLVVRSTTSTRRLARLLLPFDAEGTSVFDLKTGRLLSLQESSVQHSRTSEHHVTFDYTTRQASYTGGKTPGETRLLPIPDGDPTDLIMGLLQTRNWNLQPGQKQDALVLFNTDFYELTIYHARNEQVRTPVGTFQTSVLEPRMEKTPPKGMFKRGSTVRVWITQDERRLPVKFEVEFKIGTGTATLEAYEGPAGPPGSWSNAQDSRS